MKKILSILAVAFIFLAGNTPVLADYLFPGVPGQLVISKFVRNPQSSQFVNNLNISDFHFLPDQEVFFRLIVSNGTGSGLSNIVVTDTLPNFVNFISGPGAFDANTKTLSFTVDHLNPGEAKSFDIQARVISGKGLPTNQVTCLTNIAAAKADQLLSQATSTFCIESQFLSTVQQLPRTGPASTAIVLGASSMLLISSVLLFKKAKNS